MMTRRNIALICLFLDLDRRELLTALRAQPPKQRTDLVAGLLIEATRW